MTAAATTGPIEMPVEVWCLVKEKIKVSTAIGLQLRLIWPDLKLSFYADVMDRAFQLAVCGRIPSQVQWFYRPHVEISVMDKCVRRTIVARRADILQLLIDWALPNCSSRSWLSWRKLIIHQNSRDLVLAAQKALQRLSGWDMIAAAFAGCLEAAAALWEINPVPSAILTSSRWSSTGSREGLLFMIDKWKLNSGRRPPITLLRSSRWLADQDIITAFMALYDGTPLRESTEVAEVLLKACFQGHWNVLHYFQDHRPECVQHWLPGIFRAVVKRGNVELARELVSRFRQQLQELDVREKQYCLSRAGPGLLVLLQELWSMKG